MSKSRFRICLIPFFIIFCLTACSQAGGSLDHSEEQAVSGTANQEEEAVTEQEVAEGYQFVRGLGIISPGSPVIYRMTNLNTSEIKNEYGTAQLLNACYQDGRVIVTVLYKDYSVSVLSEEEAQQIQDTERENIKKQERGEAVSRDGSYFCIDEEKKVYGRSAFLESLQEMDTSEWKEPFGGRMYIRGSRKPEYSFDRSSFRTSFDSFLDTGYVPRLVQFMKSEKYPETDGPEGIHELKLNYFDEPFVFEFEKGMEFTSLQEFEGITERDGMWFYAEGEKENRSLAVSCYFYSDESYQIASFSPEDMTAYADVQGEDRVELVNIPLVLENELNNRETFTGVSNGSLKKLAFAIPDEPDLRNVTVQYNKPYVTDTSTIITSRIPIPQDEDALDIKAEFPDGILYLTKVSRVEDKMKRGTDGDGNDILKPQVYLTGYVEDKRSDRHIHLILATDADSEAKNNGDPFRTEMYFSDNRQGNDTDRRNGTIQGFYIGYEDGMEYVTIRFHDASFVWDTELEVPVTLR